MVILETIRILAFTILSSCTLLSSLYLQRTVTHWWPPKHRKEFGTLRALVGCTWMPFTSSLLTLYAYLQDEGSRIFLSAFSIVYKLNVARTGTIVMFLRSVLALMQCSRSLYRDLLIHVLARPLPYVTRIVGPLSREEAWAHKIHSDKRTYVERYMDTSNSRQSVVKVWYIRALYTDCGVQGTSQRSRCRYATWPTIMKGQLWISDISRFDPALSRYEHVVMGMSPVYGHIFGRR